MPERKKMTRAEYKERVIRVEHADYLERKRLERMAKEATA